MKNKNIAFLISNIDNAGGTERVSLLLGNYLYKSGYEVSFFSYYAKGHPFFYHDKKIRVIGFESQCWYMRLLSKLYPDKNDRLRFLLRLLRVNVIIDVDIGLNNLDVVMGLENRIVYNLVDVVEGNCRVAQAAIKD